LLGLGGTAARADIALIGQVIGVFPPRTYSCDLTRELALLTGHRADLIADRVRMINRLRDVLTSVFPTLEQAFDYSSHKGALVLLTEYASPHRLRRLGEARLTQWLRRRHVRDAAGVAVRALTAASGQHLELPGQQVVEMIVAELAASLLRLDDRVKVVDQQIAATFHRHQLTEPRNPTTPGDSHTSLGVYSATSEPSPWSRPHSPPQLDNIIEIPSARGPRDPRLQRDVVTTRRPR
jgi:hypothetical protein